MMLCHIWSKDMFSIWFLVVLVACCLCTWLAPNIEIAKSASQAFDSSVLLLSRFGGADDDNYRMPERVHSRGSSRVPCSERLPPVTGERYKTPTAPVKRKRVTPFVAKKVGALYAWRCAACGELLTEDFEVDHHISLQNGGSDDIQNLRPLHKRCHLLKNSVEQRRP